MARDNSVQRWFTDAFITDEAAIASRLGSSIDHPLKFFNLSQLGLDQNECLEAFSGSFENLPWDTYDVKNEQVNLLIEMLPDKEEELDNFRIEYLADRSSLAAIDELLDTLEPQSLKKIHALLPWRQRAVSTFILRLYGDKWNVEEIESTTYQQQVDPRDPRSLPREFRELSGSLTETVHFRKLLVSVGNLVREVEPHVSVLRLVTHQVRVIARRGAPGAPCPEGAHQDGAHYVLSGLVVKRNNITGGVSYVLSEDGEIAFLQTELEPGQGVFHADTASPYWHYETPCVYDTSANELSGFRDTLGFDIHIEKRSGDMPTRGSMQNPDSVEGGIGAFSIPFHREMVADVLRVEPFREAIEANCRDKIVIESGTGTGIMSLLAARAGAKHVYAIEIDPRIAAIAQKNIEQSGFADTVTLIRKDVREVTIEDLAGNRAEVVIAENLATWLVTEPQLANMNHINRALVCPNALCLPGKMTNRLELVNASFRFYDLVEIKTYFFEFTGIPTPDLLSEKVEINSWDFSQVQSLRVRKTVSVTPTRSGEVNAVRLTSLLNVTDDIIFSQCDTLLPPVVVPLKTPVSVVAGQAIAVTVYFESLTSWDAFNVDVEIAN